MERQITYSKKTPGFGL